MLSLQKKLNGQSSIKKISENATSSAFLMLTEPLPLGSQGNISPRHRKKVLSVPPMTEKFLNLSCSTRIGMTDKWKYAFLNSLHRLSLGVWKRKVEERYRIQSNLIRGGVSPPVYPILIKKSLYWCEILRRSLRMTVKVFLGLVAEKNHK